MLSNYKPWLIAAGLLAFAVLYAQGPRSSAPTGLDNRAIGRFQIQQVSYDVLVGVPPNEQTGKIQTVIRLDTETGAASILLDSPDASGKQNQRWSPIRDQVR